MAYITNELKPIRIERSAATIPDTTQTAYFTVTGRVLITQIVGEVTTVVSGTATNIKLIFNPIVGADVDLCTATTITDDAVGTVYNITGTLSDALVTTTSGAVIAQASAIVVTAGTIDLDCTATNTGEVKWTVNYEPIDQGAKVIAA